VGSSARGRRGRRTGPGQVRLPLARLGKRGLIRMGGVAAKSCSFPPQLGSASPDPSPEFYIVPSQDGVHDGEELVTREKVLRDVVNGSVEGEDLVSG
jgi:hypothetical protein